MKKPVALIIMDGFAFNDAEKGNAIKAANTPGLDKLFSENPLTTIGASGMDVGLPDGQMGNSEVGHTNIGAGRVIYQELTRISKAIDDKTFFTNEVLVKAMENCKNNNKALHLFGLLSDGGVHSHNSHLYGLLAMAKEYGVKDVVVHGLMDGRDVSPTSGVEFVRELEAMMKKIGVGVIGSLIGRYYAMDRDNRWERVESAYAAMVYGEGAHNDSAVSCMEESYAAGITDEFIEPTVIAGPRISAGDSVICFNFRPDRAREITRAFVDADFNGFSRTGGLLGVHYVCMTQYDKTMPNVNVAFLPTSLEDTFGEYISKKELNQLRIAETEKYAHVTFFFNGGVEKEYPGEDRVLVASPKVATYDLKPEMSAYEVTEKVLERIESDKYDAIILNYANCDMVGHTGVFEAAVKAVETVDECVSKVVDAIVNKGGVALITADHGNADQLIDPETGGVFTAHTTNPVPLCVIGAGDVSLKEGGKLCDLAPTMLDVMGLEKPKLMTGTSLLSK